MSSRELQQPHNRLLTSIKLSKQFNPYLLRPYLIEIQLKHLIFITEQ